MKPAARPLAGTGPGLYSYLDSMAHRYESRDFVASDPISIPLGFDDPRDQEIIGLYSALLAWGRRETILNKMAELCERMSFRPYRFVSKFGPSAAGKLEGFGHRTFTSGDAVHLTASLRVLLEKYSTIENVFRAGLDHAKSTEESTVAVAESGPQDVGPAIQFFSEAVMSARRQNPPRLQKHLARPRAGSACKRLCMYLRWMVRPGPVDLGIWTSIPKSDLVVPLDVHSGRQARALGLLARAQNDWKAALELTKACRELDQEDPARFDFALFGSGAFGETLDPQFVVGTDGS